MEQQPGISLRYAGDVKTLGQPDMVIVPGSKNTMSDLKWMRQNGMEAAILKLAAANVPVLGICGGYQMLGESIEDPDGEEGGRKPAWNGAFAGSNRFWKGKGADPGDRRNSSKPGRRRRAVRCA